MDGKVRAFIENHQMLTTNSTVLLGVSGGPDSMALLHFFWSIREQWGLNLIVVSADHQLRGKESTTDLEYVRDICVKWDIHFIGASLDVPLYKREKSLGTQVAARELRYDFFEKQMSRLNADFLALGHHGDDQIETMLMGLGRSANPKSISGIPVTRVFATGRIIRPLLCVTKEEIEVYCVRYDIIPRRDPSNNETVYTRNFFRKQLVPLLKERNSNLHKTMQQLSESIHDDERFLMEQTMSLLDDVVAFNWQEQKAFFSISAFKSYPRSLQRRAYHLILNYLYKVLPKKLSYVHEEQFFKLLNNGNDGSVQIDFPHGLKLARSYQTFTFYLLKEKAEFIPNHVIFEVPGKADWSGTEITAHFTDYPGRQTAESYLCRHDEVALPLHIRTRQAGDRMSWAGLKGSKKVKDIFIDAKIPLSKRDNWPVVVDNNGVILWVVGLKKGRPGTQMESGTYIQLVSKKTPYRRDGGSMNDDIEKVLITEEEIANKCSELGKQLTNEYDDKFPLAIGVLKGALPFMSDILRHMQTHLEMDFMDVSSYGGKMRSSGEVKIVKDLDTKVEGRDLLIIEDIIDSGLTLSYLVDLFKYRKAKSIKIVTLLDKPSGRTAHINADIIGFEVPNEFVVGYGLDYEEKYRNLPYIGVLKPKIYGGEES